MRRRDAGTTRSQLERWALAHAHEFAARQTAFLGVYPDAEGKTWPTADDIRAALVRSRHRVHRLTWICNTQDYPNAPGRHWVALGLHFMGARPVAAEFGDSFGAQGDAELNRLLAAHGRDREHFTDGLKSLLRDLGGNPAVPIITNARPVQDLLTDVCGEYALAMAMYGPPGEWGPSQHEQSAYRFWHDILRGGPLQSDARIRRWAKIRSPLVHI